MIKSGFERLVLDEHPLVRRQFRMCSAQIFLEPLLAQTDVGGAGIIRSVSKPERISRLPSCFAISNTLFHVLRRDHARIFRGSQRNRTCRFGLPTNWG